MTCCIITWGEAVVFLVFVWHDSRWHRLFMEAGWRAATDLPRNGRSRNNLCQRLLVTDSPSSLETRMDGAWL